ncbi:MAG: hypothetical protein LBS04_03205 [Tannerellaceae bacterium]|jgi:hypothetical protein|nr:hypothetical protein [Tannerellaceae bacterium]
MEICYKIDFRRPDKIEIPSCKRIYFGHETCEKLLPEFNEIRKLLELSEKRNLELTFVTPFLTDKGIEKVMRFLEELKTAVQDFEIVVSDWGLLHLISSNKTGIPVISRFLTGQQTDFRLNRFEKTPPLEMEEHLASCTLLKKQSLAFFDRYGIERFELSNTPQTVKTGDCDKYRYSLYIPFIPLSIFRTCPENFDFNHIRENCNSRMCKRNRVEWSNPASGYKIYCIDNALYYANPDYEAKLHDNMYIDRIVCDIATPFL